MSGSFSGRFSFKLLCAFLCAVIGFSFAVVFTESHLVRADGNVSVSVESWGGDDANMYLSVSGFSEGQNVDVTISVSSEVYASGSAAVIVLEDGSYLKLRIIGWNGDEGSPNGDRYYISLFGTNISDLSAEVEDIVVSRNPDPDPTNTPTPEPTATPVPTNTPTPTPKPTQPQQTQAQPQQTQPKTTSAEPAVGGGDEPADTPEATESTDATESASEVTETTVASTAASVVVATETPTVEETTSSDEAGDVSEETNDDQAPVVAALTATGGGGKKDPGKTSVWSWLWIVLLIIAGGLLYLRYRYLKKNENLDGMDLAIAFIPGVPFLAEKFFGYLGPVKSMNLVSTTSDKSSFNTANAMKEIKAMEAAEGNKPAASKPVNHLNTAPVPRTVTNTAEKKATVTRPGTVTVASDKKDKTTEVKNTKQKEKPMDQHSASAPKNGPVKRSRNELTPEQIAEREKAAKLLEERRAAQAARVAEIRKNADARKAKAFEEAKLAEEARKADEARKAEEARKAVEARKAEEARIAEEAAKAAELARTEEARKAEEAAKAAAIAKAKAEAIAAEARQLQEAAKAAERARREEEARKREDVRKREEARKTEEARKAEEARLEAEAKAAEEARKAEEARSLEEAKAAERARREALEAEKAAAAAKAEAEAKLAEAQRAMKAADAAREAKAEMNKKQSKTSAFFKNQMASNEGGVMPAISALASVDGYDKALEKNAEKKMKTADAEREKNNYGTFKSGSSSGVGASASRITSDGPSISAERAKASSNSNQLGTLLAGKSYNNSGRTPVWSAPGRNIAAFKESEEAREARLREEQRRIEQEQAKKAEEEKAKSSYTSIADSAKTRKSAFFKRAPVSRDTDSNSQEEHTSAYGGIVRPSAIVDEERDIKKNMTVPAMGAALEGQRPSIMEPNSKAAPTASKPLAGFKGSDSVVNREDDSSENK